MKKNLTFKLGLFCAALVLVSTCFITNAWARYTKTVTATDTARVAKFVVDFKDGETNSEISTSIDIFGTKLNNIIADENGNNVASSAKIIAPGSFGSFEVDITNNSEVSVKVSLEGTTTLSKTVTGVDDSTMPIKFCVSDTIPANDSSYKTISQTFTTVSGITLGTTSTTNTKKITVYWKWIEGSTNEVDNNFAALANAADGLTVTASLSLTAEQVLPE